MFIFFGTQLYARSDFTSDNDMLSCNKYFTRDTAFRITDNEAINDTISNDIGTFIGMPGLTTSEVNRYINSYFLTLCFMTTLKTDYKIF